MAWVKAQILGKLRRLHERGDALAYSKLARKNQALLSAAAYHFGSYRKALEKAGLDYSQILQRPRWTKQRIITLIKQARRAGQDLHWGAVTRRRDELGRAAFAALQPRLFGRWDRALHAAGLDADDVARYRTWDRNTIVFEIRSRHQDGEPLNSGALQKEDPGLHAAAVRYFGSYDKALRAARIDPLAHRQRKKWSRQSVLRALKLTRSRNGDFSGTTIRANDPALYGAVMRVFGSFGNARKAAGIKTK
ncbi:MAG TPA: hypothetical protein VH518_24955 [Tepidisphaeraceae bacterium]|jgi:hypothetical protein